MHTMPQPDPIGKYLAGSIGFHAGIIALLVFSGAWKFTKNNWGSQQVSTGSVGISIVKTIPLPRKEAPENPLANDTDSDTPQAPAPVKMQAQVKAPEPKAIAIPEKVQRKVSPKQQSVSTYRPPAEEYRPNQVYSQTPQATSSKMYGMQGTAGIDVGPASVLGDKCGPYADVMRNLIAGKWNRADVNAAPTQMAAVTFTIAKNGAISNPKVSHPSGSYLLDTSALRAVLDSNPLPPLTAPCDRNEATVELRFQLQH
jgi:periplasmic protein TonB